MLRDKKKTASLHQPEAWQRANRFVYTVGKENVMHTCSGTLWKYTRQDSWRRGEVKKMDTCLEIGGSQRGPGDDRNISIAI